MIFCTKHHQQYKIWKYGYNFKVRGEDDLGDCIGKGIDFNDCPYFSINFNMADDLDVAGFNCVGRL